MNNNKKYRYAGCSDEGVIVMFNKKYKTISWKNLPYEALLKTGMTNMLKKLCQKK